MRDCFRFNWFYHTQTDFPEGWSYNKYPEWASTAEIEKIDTIESLSESLTWTQHGCYLDHHILINNQQIDRKGQATVTVRA